VFRVTAHIESLSENQLSVIPWLNEGLAAIHKLLLSFAGIGKYESLK
jgi:hypothetical protein